MNIICNRGSLGDFNEFKTSKDSKEEESNPIEPEEKDGTLEEDIEKLFP